MQCAEKSAEEFEKVLNDDLNRYALSANCLCCQASDTSGQSQPDNAEESHRQSCDDRELEIPIAVSGRHSGQSLSQTFQIGQTPYPFRTH